MKITITGASGFVGLNLKKYLNSSHNLSSLSVRFLKDQKIIIDLDSEIIIHLSGKAHDLKNVSNPTDYYESNFELTKQLFDAFLISNASTFIFMSTVKASADKVTGILKETDIPDPKTHYGIAKLQAENYILSKEIPIGKRVYILRPCMIHGPENKGNLNLLFKLVSKNLPWPLGSFENKRSFLSIDNLCFVINELIVNDTIPSDVYQISDDLALSTNELIQIIGESLNKKSKNLKISTSFIRRLSKIGDVLHLHLNTERLDKLTENYIVSNDKIKKVMNKNLPISSREGLVKTFKSFQNKKQ